MPKVMTVEQLTDFVRQGLEKNRTVQDIYNEVRSMGVIGERTKRPFSLAYLYRISSTIKNGGTINVYHTSSDAALAEVRTILRLRSLSDSEKLKEIELAISRK